MDDKLQKKLSKLDVTIFGKKNIEESLAMLYHENSKFNKYKLRKNGERIEAFNSPYIIARAAQPYKIYPANISIDLNLYKMAPQVALHEILALRRSLRQYNENYKISLNEIAYILYNSYGVTKTFKIADSFEADGNWGLRNVPSAGGLYPLELYIVILNGHISSGIYHYRSDTNTLELIKEGNFLDYLRENMQCEPYVNISTASAVIFSTGIFERVAIKYGDRAYRFLIQESGIVGQTITLLLESIGLGSCWIGAYIDDMINELLEIDGVYESVNNVIVIGKKEISMDNLITLQNVSYFRNEKKILDKISFTIGRGEKIALLGSNGAGKSTLIDIMTQDINPTDGNIFFDRTSVFPKNRTGVLYGCLPLFPYLRVFEQIRYFTAIYRLDYKEVEKEYYKRLGIDKIENSFIYQLSQGERQKLGLLISIINNPELLIWMNLSVI